MHIAMGTDHAGFDLKEHLKRWLVVRGHTVLDFGTHSAERCDYPQFVRPAAEAVADGRCALAIVFGGSGNGEAMVANKVKGVRCALCFSEDTARWARGHNDANCLALGARTVSIELAERILELFLATPFEGGRHEARVKAIEGG